MRLAERVFFRTLLIAYPARFRRMWGAEMAQVFTQRLDEASGPRARFRLWARTLDVARSAAAERGRAARAWLKTFLWPAPPPEQRPPSRGDNPMANLWRDLRFALRTLRKYPGFTVAAVTTLALGIGATTAIFSVVDAVLLRPLPYAQGQRIMTLWETEKDGSSSNTSFATFLDWKEQTRTLEEVAARSYWNPTLSGTGAAERLEGLRVTDGFFRALGVVPAIGRDFIPQEDRAGNNRVVVLGHGLWQRRFGGDPGLLGRMITLNGNSYTVVGILPADFESLFSTNLYAPAEVWAPLGYDASQPWACRTCRHLRALGRLKPGVSRAEAAAELNRLTRALAAEHPQDYPAAGALVTPLAEQLTARVRTPLLVLLGAVGLVLLIACANVTHLLLGAARRREREIAIRIAIGAGRGRIARQLLTESLLLAALGGAAGLVFAYGANRLLVALAPATIPRLANSGLDLRVLLVTASLSLLTGLVFGLVPALQASRAGVGVGEALKAGTVAGGPRGRLRGLLVVADVALALVLTAGAGLMLRTLVRLLDVDAGFSAKGLLTLELDASGPRYREDPPVRAFYRQVLEQVRALPGVAEAGVVSQLPLGGNLDSYGLHVEDRPLVNPADAPFALRYSVSPGYLRAMSIPLLRGRSIAEADGPEAPPVVLLNDTAARRLWPGGDPLGRRVRVGDPSGPWRTVVGVVGDVQHDGLDAPPAMQVYIPHSQWTDAWMVLAVRTAGDPSRLAAPVRQIVASLDKDQPVSNVATMEQVVHASLTSRRFVLVLLLAFAGVALALAAVGIAGVVSQAVAGRSREIGVRLALGARPRDILGVVVGESARDTLAGLACGLLASLALTRLLSSLLFDVTTTDPLTLAGVCALLGAVASAAAYVPARRAARVDPMEVLRTE